jgi:hypothetical protein
LEASFPTVVDLPDGGFELRPDPRPMRSLKWILGAGAVSTLHWRRPGWLFPEGIGEFAQRLGVPLPGDFSEKVKDTVDLSKTN